MKSDKTELAVDAMGRPLTQPVIEFINPEAAPQPPVEPIKKERLDLAKVREELASRSDKDYWRSLDELAGTEEFQEFLHAEFPRQSSGLGTVDRREFLKLSGASLALAGLAACTKQPIEKIVPYVNAPEDVIPGKPLFFASSTIMGGYAQGVLVESHMGRPTKIEGNPEHPASLGATTAFTQAAILDLYDPDRSRSVTYRGTLSTWDLFLKDLGQAMASQDVKKGAGIRILTETVTSPTLAGLIKGMLDKYPKAKWHQYEAAGANSSREGSKLAFGEVLNPIYHFDKANVVLSLESDFLAQGPGSVRYARDFSSRKYIDGKKADVNCMYAVESVPSVTGMAADHRVPVRSSQVEKLARAVAKGVGVNAAGADAGQHQAWVEAVIADLKHQKGTSIVIAGETQPPVVHALAHAINEALGNHGKTITFSDSVESVPVDQFSSLRELATDMNAGDVDLLVTIGANPIYSAPGDLEITKAFDKVSKRVHLGTHFDETARLSHWHIPQAHDLEAWGDARAFDGTVSIIQPLIEPLYSGKAATELMVVLCGQGIKSSHDIVLEAWKLALGKDGFDKKWRKILHEGFAADSQAALQKPKVTATFTEAPSQPAQAELEIIFRADPTVWDGRFSNNGWLQELPKPITKMTWDNVFMVSPSTAERLKLHNEDLVELRYGGKSIQGPIWIVPGHAHDSVSVQLGYGRALSGKVGTDVGYDANALRKSDRPWFDSGAVLTSAQGTYPLASSQHHHLMNAGEASAKDEEMVSDLESSTRNLVRETTQSDFKKHPEFAKHAHREHAPAPGMTLYPPYDYSKGEQWGMTINLNQCIGCNACIVACQSENNIPVVGKLEVSRGREMHWLRVDQYFAGNLDNPKMKHQPVPCMHCELAPCETVCPVGATVHSKDGLNQMVYNRCVGTRYCSNNCPYKVRRFNFFQYGDLTTESLKLQRNPDVTNRVRGVMEKCTYCVQRINEVRVEHKKSGKPIKDGEVKTACQQACPTRAISFGDLNDPESVVVKQKASPLNYTILADVNTRARTTYLARVTNPNTTLSPADTSEHDGHSGGHH